MSEELKKAVDKIGDSFAAMQKANDERFEQIEEKGNASADAMQKTQQIADDLTKLTEQHDAVKAAMSRIPKNTGDEKGLPESAREYKSALNAHLRGEEGADERAKAASAAFHAEMKADAGMAAELKTIYVGSDPDGGFGVGIEDGGMLNPTITEFSNMRNRASVRTGMKPEIEYIVNKKGFGSVVKASELQAYVKTTTGQLGKQTIAAHTHYALPTISENMLEDSDFDVLGWMNSEVGEGFATYDDNQGFLGTGVGEGKGILTRTTAAASGTVPYGSVALYASGGATSFVAENLIQMSGGLKRPYYTGTVNWFVQRQTFFNQLATLKNGDNDFRFVLPDFTSGVTFKMLGFDVDFAPDMPSGATEDNIALAFGNFRTAFTYYDRTGITVKRFEEVESPEVWYRYRRRNGCDVTNFESYSLMEMST